MQMTREQQSYVEDAVRSAIDAGLFQHISSELLKQLQTVALCRPEDRQYAHTVAARALDIGLQQRDVVKVLRALARHSSEGTIYNDFIHWMWDNYGSIPGAYIAFDDCKHLREQAIEQVKEFEGDAA